jgi:hypothetical protein
MYFILLLFLLLFILFLLFLHLHVIIPSIFPLASCYNSTALT